jgi:hypothetical protein
MNISNSKTYITSKLDESNIVVISPRSKNHQQINLAVPPRKLPPSKHSRDLQRLSHKRPPPIPSLPLVSKLANNLP